MRRLAAIVATASILIACQSQAQTRNNLLRGLSKVELVIEDLTDHDKVCGLTTQALRAAVMFRISSTKIEVGPISNVVFYVNALTSYLDSIDFCISNLDIEVYAYQTVTLDFSGEEKRAHVRLWTAGKTMGSQRVNHLQRISAAIEDETKKFITDWNLDNRIVNVYCNPCICTR
jgi:hypothetical protein